MGRRPTYPGDRVKIKGGVVLYVKEHPHAYLIRGPGIMWGPTIDQARLALFEHLGRKKWTRIARMPARPLYTRELGDEHPCGAVALYFNVGPGATRHDGNAYKP